MKRADDELMGGNPCMSYMYDGNKALDVFKANYCLLILLVKSALSLHSQSILFSLIVRTVFHY